MVPPESRHENILVVGAGGAVAEKLLPELNQTYKIVGIARRRRELEPHCIELISTELTAGASQIWDNLFSRYDFRAIIWNAVRYHPAPLLETSRGTLHLEFDLAVGLPLECLQAAIDHGFAGSFVLVTSGLAFGTKPPWGSYSIAKRGQVILAEYLAAELHATNVLARAVALGTISAIPTRTINDVFMHAIGDADRNKVLYRAYNETWD